MTSTSKENIVRLEFCIIFGEKDRFMTKAVKYIVRAVKYFFYFSILLAVLLWVLVFANVLDGNIETMFKDGYNSLWKIALLFAAVSAVYPVFGFMKRDTFMPGEHCDLKPGIVKFMEGRGYRLEKEEGENLTFRNRNFLYRMFRMCEDRITFTRIFRGYSIEGLRKDVVRLISGLEHYMKCGEE